MEHPELYGPDHAHPQGLARAKAAMEAADRKRIEAVTDAISLASDFLEEARDNLNLSLLDIPSRASLRDMAISDLRRAAATLDKLRAHLDGRADEGDAPNGN